MVGNKIYTWDAKIKEYFCIQVLVSTAHYCLQCGAWNKLINFIQFVTQPHQVTNYWNYWRNL